MAQVEGQYLQDPNTISKLTSDFVVLQYDPSKTLDEKLTRLSRKERLSKAISKHGFKSSTQTKLGDYSQRNLAAYTGKHKVSLSKQFNKSRSWSIPKFNQSSLDGEKPLGLEPKNAVNRDLIKVNDLRVENKILKMQLNDVSQLNIFHNIDNQIESNPVCVDVYPVKLFWLGFRLALCQS